MLFLIALKSLPGDRPPPLSPPRSRLPLRTTSRQELCRELDLPSALGDNWKGLAAKIGLDIREIRFIEYGRYSSCTEEVFINLFLLSFLLSVTTPITVCIAFCAIIFSLSSSCRHVRIVIFV